MHYFSDDDQNVTEDILEIISASVGNTLIELSFSSSSNAVLQNWNAFIERGILIKIAIRVPAVTAEMVRALFQLASLQNLPYFSIRALQ